MRASSTTAGSAKRQASGIDRATIDGAKPNAIAVTEVAGIPLDANVAERVASSIGPAFEGFAAISGTLPFDLEPASFLLAQTLEVGK